MFTYYFEVAFDGTDFFGWQNQPKQISVQETIEKVLSKLHGNQEIKIVGCGRTDTGVHAKSYVFHAQLSEVTSLEQLKHKMNKMLPSSIVINEIKQVDDDFHARYSARWRTYRYFIHLKKDPFKVRHSTYLHQQPDFVKMNLACEFLIGNHDFTTFSKVNSDVKSHDCEVKNAKWITDGNDEVYFEITANRFLRNMVRATVGTLLDVGYGKITPEEFKLFLNAKDRRKSSASAPAEGLFLWGVEY